MASKVLVANRGEIAVRIIRACKELNIRTVAVYSDADANAKHVAECDEAYRLGPAAARESYLRGDLILEIAKRSGAEAIHMSVGFADPSQAYYLHSHGCIGVRTISQARWLFQNTPVGTPVIVTGESPNRGKGFTYDPASHAEYFALLDRIPSLPCNTPAVVARARTYAGHSRWRL